ncbi:ATP-grasp domain-containing protein [Xenorhabdus thuongxuanensis]|uniref:HsvC-like protein n=1 Tax=Xenorhabdus thuongxuanensis TaxID=1873484 RepID=A0A1Q5U172_9GAMM|nr:ATP-grasp domain-containing protein [Xenorhabdus thuongxuanensis]OKP06229.1 HsvC-like protein [Xenorhabdus thuongxuanensis]
MIILSLNAPTRHNEIPDWAFHSHDIIIFSHKDNIHIISKDIQQKAKAVWLYEYESELFKFIENSGFDFNEIRVFCATESFMDLAAIVRDKYSIFGIKSELSTLFRNKLKMKSKLTNVVRVPTFGKYKHQTFEMISSEVGLPFVLKPVDSAGSEGVYIINTNIDFINSVNCISESLHEYEYEEFIDGTLYHVDMVIQNGLIIFGVSCEYNAPNSHFLTGVPCLSIILPHQDKLHNELYYFSKKVIGALGLDNGVTHMEIFRDNNTHELIFLEVGARPAGGVNVNLFKRKFGIDLVEESLKIELGLKVSDIKPINELYFIAGTFPTLHGKLINIKNPSIESEFELNCFYTIGDKMDTPTSLRSRGADIIVYNNCYNALKKDFSRLCNFHPFIVEQCHNKL